MSKDILDQTKLIYHFDLTRAPRLTDRVGQTGNARLTGQVNLSCN